MPVCHNSDRPNEPRENEPGDQLSVDIWTLPKLCWDFVAQLWFGYKVAMHNGKCPAVRADQTKKGIEDGMKTRWSNAKKVLDPGLLMSLRA